MRKIVVNNKELYKLTYDENIAVEEMKENYKYRLGIACYDAYLDEPALEIFHMYTKVLVFCPTMNVFHWIDKINIKDTFNCTTGTEILEMVSSRFEDMVNDIIKDDIFNLTDMRELYFPESEKDKEIVFTISKLLTFNIEGVKLIRPVEFSDNITSTMLDMVGVKIILELSGVLPISFNRDLVFRRRYK